MKKSYLFYWLTIPAFLICVNASHSFEPAWMPVQEKVGSLETDHFLILYQLPLSDSVQGLARNCEEAYYVITGVLGWKPREKTRVLFMDIADTHNGWSISIPHNTMAIYASGSEQGSTIYQPGNYLRRTVFHELMHTFSMDMRHGYNDHLSRIFGKVAPMGDILSSITFLLTASPVTFSPRWFLEGTSIWAETEFAGPGRGRSTMVDMIFRSAVKDNNLLPYSKWYLETPYWPFGNSAYLYGMRMVQYLYEEGYGPNPVGDMTDNISKQFLLNFNRGVRTTTREPWRKIALEMLFHERTTQNENLRTLSQTPFTPMKRLTPGNIPVYYVLYAGQKIYFLGADEEDRHTLFSYDPKTGQYKKFDRSIATPPMGGLSASVDGNRVYYTRLEYRDLENLWYEVRVYDVTRDSDKLITRNGRYRSVDLSPDGKKFAAVSQRQAKTYLLEVPVNEAGEKAHETLLVSSPLEVDIASPRYSPNGGKIVFVQADRDRFYLKLFDLSKSEVITLWDSPAQIIAPAWHPDGEQIVFGSDENGVYNLYRISAGGISTPIPITHVPGGLFFPSFSNDGRSIAVVSYDGFGPHLSITPYHPDSFTHEEMPAIRPHWAGGKMDTFKAEAKAKKREFETIVQRGEQGGYNSLANIRPDFWSPWLTPSSEGLEVGAIAAFSDPARYQNLTLLAGIETEYSSPLAGVKYSYRRLGPEMILYGGAGQDFYPDLLIDQDSGSRFDYAEETRFIGAAVSYPLFNRLERRLLGTLGYEYKSRKPIGELEDKYQDRNLEQNPTSEAESPLWGRLSYFSGTVFNRSVSIEDGALAFLSAEQSLKELGGDINTTRARADINQYISLPIRENHVLKLHGAYGQGWGDETAQGLFGVGGMKSIVDETYPGVQHNLYLRGYDQNFQIGQRALTAGVSYRFPLWNLFKGYESAFPVYTRSLTAELFYEGGRTWDDNGDGDRYGWLNAVGTEVNFGMTMLRYLQFSPGIGVVYAPENSDGGPGNNEDLVVYFSIKGWYDF